MKPALAAVALNLAFALAAGAEEPAPPLGELSAVSQELVTLGQLAPVDGATVQSAKVENLADRVVDDFRGVERDVRDYAQASGETLPAAAEVAAPHDAETFVDEVVDRCSRALATVEAARRQGVDPELDAVLRRAARSLRLAMNDARRARGEYVPLSQPQD